MDGRGARARGAARRPTWSSAPRSAAPRPAGRSTARRSTRARPRRSRASTCSSTTRRSRAVKGNTLAAIEAGVAVVIGTSGLTADDFADIDTAARERSVGVVASGNFSLTAAMASAAALLAARHLPNWEVIDYASATKPDVPSGTARELAERLGGGRRLGAAALRRPRAGGGARRDRLRHPGPLGAPPELRGLDRGRVRPPRRAAHDPPRRGRHARALRRRHAAGGRRVPELVGLTRGLDTLLVS